MELIYGICSVRNALLSHRRSRLERLLVYQPETPHQPSQLGRKIGEILKMAHERVPKIKIQHVSKVELDRLIGGGRPHQNVAIACSPLHLPTIDKAPKSSKRSVIVVLDGIKDPQNLGALIRTSYFLSATGLVIPSAGNQCTEITGAVSRASAGVVEGWDGVYRTGRILEFLSRSKTDGWKVFVADVNDDDENKQSHKINSIDQKILLVMGEEGSGISSGVKALADAAISVPSTRDSSLTDSLNVSVAAGILLDRLINRE